MTRGRFAPAVLLAGALVASWGCAEAVSDPPSEVLEDEDYLLQLGLMRGHLLVGDALFALGERDAARTHSKHPADELYLGIEPAFEALGLDGFAAQLAAHSDAVNSGDEAAVAEAYATLTAAMAAAEEAVELSHRLAARVIVLLLREAAREYALGIVDNQPANVHEYQDAYGFTQVALAWSRRAAESGDDAARRLFGRMAETLEALDDMWPSLTPPMRVEQSAARLYGAAAQIEILALNLAR